MSNFPALSGKKVIRILEKFDFEIIRTKGSHYFLRHSDGRSTTVPVPSNESIGIGLLLQVLKDCEIDKNDFLKMV